MILPSRSLFGSFGVQLCLSLEDGVSNGEIEPVHIPESDMAADPFTKYLPRDVWLRHMRFVTNTQVENK